jgi:CMP-N,N'-diacetyllegionaminic acid synthase
VTHPRFVALIPARAGSKRVPGKNVRRLAGHPLIAYTIAAALQSELFSAVLVSTDSEYVADISRYYGAEVPFLRPAEYAGDRSPDIEWVEYTLARLADEGRPFDCFSILRPTSPFRLPVTIQRAARQFVEAEKIHSLRAVELCKQHPGKMWVIHGDRMTPLLLNPTGVPWHSTQYQALPSVYVQNASLEIAWTSVVTQTRSIAGSVLAPFLTEGYEGFDINDGQDWIIAEALVEQGAVSLPTLSSLPYPD